VSQPQISGGSTSTSGGMSHSGMDSTSSTMASSVEPSDHSALAVKEAAVALLEQRETPLAHQPHHRGRHEGGDDQQHAQHDDGRGQRDHHQRRDHGAQAAGAEARSQPPSWPMKDDDSSQRNTAFDRPAQNSQPSPSASPAITSSGSSDRVMTRGCRQ
jgi:hypothetical protein